MPETKYAIALLVLAAIGLRAEVAAPPGREVHQAPDKDGVYYAGPEVTAPRLVRTVYVPYPEGISGKEVQGITVLAMVIDANGIPTQIQVLRSHGQKRHAYPAWLDLLEARVVRISRPVSLERWVGDVIRGL